MPRLIGRHDSHREGWHWSEKEDGPGSGWAPGWLSRLSLARRGRNRRSETQMNSNLKDARPPRASWMQTVTEMLSLAGRRRWLALPAAAVSLAAILVVAVAILGVGGGGSAHANAVGSLLVVKVCPQEAAVGQPVIYTIGIGNTGATDTLSIDAVDDPMLGGDIKSLFGDLLLSPGEFTSSGSILRFVEESDPRPLVNTVTVDASYVPTGALLTAQASCTLDVVSLTLTKTAVFDNGKTIYTFVITNDGNVPLQRGFVEDSLLGVITSQFPASLAVGESVTVVIERVGEECDNTVTASYQSTTEFINTRADAFAECGTDGLSFLTAVQFDETGAVFSGGTVTFHICAGDVVATGCDVGNAIITTTNNPTGPIPLAPGTYTVCVVEPAGFVVDPPSCKTAEVPASGTVSVEFITRLEDGGTEGCTPGFWKNHLDDWGPTGFDPNDDFDAVFGVDLFDPDITLDDAVNAKGGGVKKLARHGTAALLNAAHPAVDYPLSVAEVIAAVQAGDLGDIPDFNELSSTCPAVNGNSF